MKEYTHLLTEPYFDYKGFLSECRNKEYSPEIVLHSHHIIPKFMGGKNNKENLILLSVEDHIKAHYLLNLCFDKDCKQSIMNLRSMRLIDNFSVSNNDQLKLISESYKGELNPFYGKTHTLETRLILSEHGKIRKNVSYEKLYFENAEIEKQKRAIGVKESWSKLTEEQKKIRASKSSKSLKGREVHNSVSVTIEGVTYKSIAEAARKLQTSEYYIKRKINAQIN